MHRRLDDLVLRITHLESDMTSVKHQSEKMQKLTDDAVLMRVKAEGAGTAVCWLIRADISIVAFAGWVLGICTWITGRPPP